MHHGKLVPVFVFAAICATSRPAAGQPAENISMFQPASFSTLVQTRDSAGGWSIDTPTCTRSRARKIICGGASTGLGLYVGIPSAIILYEALGSDSSDEDPFGVGRSLRKTVIFMAGSLFVLGGAFVYLGVDLLIDAFRPPSKYAFSPVVEPRGTGLSIRVQLP